jgi:hypothetical protein
MGVSTLHLTANECFTAQEFGCSVFNLERAAVVLSPAPQAPHFPAQTVLPSAPSAGNTLSD